MRELETNPPPLTGNCREDEATLANLRRTATQLQQRWGCPAAGLAPPPTLPRDLASEARHVARVTGTPEAMTCPFACIRRASTWVVEVTTAVSLADWRGFAEALGREPTAADDAALAALKQAQHDALDSDRHLIEQERASAAEAAKAGTPGPRR